MTTNDISKAFDPAAAGATELGATMKDGIDLASDTAAKAIDDVSDKAHSVREKLTPVLKQGVDHAQTLVDQGLGALRDASEAFKDKAEETTERVADYTKDQPIKALLIAASVGAGLAMLFGLVRSRK